MSSRARSWALCGLLIWPGWVAHGADSEGKFAGQGVGLAPCQSFVRARDEQSRDYFLFGGWIDGYFSARNEIDAQTYTLTPWQSLEVLAAFLTDYCHKNPDTPFQRAVMVMAEALKPQRLQQSSERQTVQVGQQQQVFFSAVILHIQQRLQALSELEKTPDGVFDEATAAGLRRYQKTIGLPVTGFPDQHTLFQLLMP